MADKLRGGSTVGGNIIWHAGNDGTGSGLDADLLDGQSSAYYATATSVTALEAKDPVLTLAGDVTGTATFTNLGNATLTAVVADDSHNHSNYLPLSGGTLTSNLLFSNSGTSKRGVMGTVGDNDFWFIGGGATGSNSGFMEIATGDDGQGSAEPIYVSQYGPGSPLNGTLFRRATLLDTNGNTSFPETVTAPTFLGALSGNASTATKLQTARTISLSGDVTGSTTFDGSGNVSISATVANDSHTHSNYLLNNSNDEFVGQLTVDNTGKLASTYTWTGSAIQTTSIEIIDANTDDSSVCPTLFMHNYGDGGVKFRMGNTGDKTLYFSSGQGSDAGSPTDNNAGTYFNAVKLNGNIMWHAGNDGSSSGLDADLLDGQHGSYYSPTSHTHSYLPLAGGTLTGALTGTTGSFSGKVDFQGDAAVEGGSGYGVFKGYTSNDNHFIVVRGAVANQASLSITGGHQTTFVEHAENNDTSGWYFKSHQTGSYAEIARITRTGGMHLQGNKVWHAGNDGSGSGLDADLLDGNQAAAFALKTGTAFTGQVSIDYGSPKFIVGSTSNLDTSDSNRPNITLNGGMYPHMTIDARVDGSGNASTNTTHGPVFSFVSALGTGYRRWAMGTAAKDAGALSFGYYDNNANPHYGMGGNAGYTGTGASMWLATSGSLSTTSQGTLWGATNDGSGSGLDADTVDGIQGASLVRNDTGNQVINGDHGTARLQIRRTTDTTVEGQKAYLSMWASEPGITHDGAGIGGNIANAGFYYGVENTAQAGSLIRFYQGNTEFKYLPAVAGANNPGTRTFYIDTSGNCTATGNVTAYSDERLKTNIKTISTPLDKVKALRGVTFDKDGERGLGVIAQEIEAVIPEVVMTANDEMGTKSVAYGNMVGLLIEAIKEQQVQVKEQQTQIDELKALVQALIK